MYDKQQVLELLNNSSEKEDLYDDSGSDYSVSRSRSNHRSSDSDDNFDSPVLQITKKSKEIVRPSAKKQKVTPSTVSSSKGKGKGKKRPTRPVRSTSQSDDENIDLDLVMEDENDRLLLDADDDMPQIDAIDLEIADSEWIDAHPGFSPQFHPFKQENAGIHFDTDFTEFDYAAQFLNNRFWRLVVRETNIKAEVFCS